MKGDDVKTVILVCSLFVNVGVVLLFGYKYYVRISYDNLEQTTINSSYWQDKVTFFEILNKQQKGDIFLVGDSMFDRLNVEDVFADIGIRNRGIGFDNTKSLAVRLDRSVLSGAPKKIFLFIGGNDLSSRDDIEVIISDTEKIIKTIINDGIEVCFVSILPKGEKYAFSQRSTADINNDTAYFNKKIKRKCIELGSSFLDVTPSFVSKEYYLEGRWTSDEIHLNAEGVVLLAKLLSPHID